MFVKFHSFQLRHNKIICTVSNINLRITTTWLYKINLHYMKNSTFTLQSMQLAVCTKQRNTSSRSFHSSLSPPSPQYPTQQKRWKIS